MDSNLLQCNTLVAILLLVVVLIAQWIDRDF